MEDRYTRDGWAILDTGKEIFWPREHGGLAEREAEMHALLALANRGDQAVKVLRRVTSGAPFAINEAKAFLASLDTPASPR